MLSAVFLLLLYTGLSISLELSPINAAYVLQYHGFRFNISSKAGRIGSVFEGATSSDKTI